MTSATLTQPLPTEPLGILVAPWVAQAADLVSTGSPGTVEDKEGAGTVKWGGASNAKASDDSYATAELGPNTSTHYLQATNFKFAIPEGASVLGVITGVERSAPTGGITESTIKLVKAGVVVGSNRALVSKKGVGQLWPESDTYETYGDVDDLWGETWTPTQVNDNGFGVVVRAKNNSLAFSHEARVDHIKITVYYTEAEDENRICFAERSIELRSDGVYRQHPTDDVWGTVVPEGFLPYASPSGMEGRKTRIIVIPTQGDLGELPHSGSNPLSAQASHRPAYLFAREAADE